MRSPFRAVLPLSLSVLACASDPPPPAAPPAVMTTPTTAATEPVLAPSASGTPASSDAHAEPRDARKDGPRLEATPEARLGTAPASFGLAVGTKAPALALPDAAGGTVKLGDVYAKGPTLIVFYRGGWCPFCNVQLHDLAAAKKDFDAKGVSLFAISVDKPSEEAKTQAKQEAPFPFLSDSNLAAHRAFHVVHVPDAEEKAKLEKYHLDLASYSGQKHGDFAVPSIFLVDRKGIVRFAHVDDDYKTRPSPAQLLAVIDRTHLE